MAHSSEVKECRGHCLVRADREGALYVHGAEGRRAPES